MTVAGAIMSILTLLTVVYFWLTEHARLQRYVLAFVPQHRRTRARDVWNQAETRLGMWVRGQLILMATIGLATGGRVHASSACRRRSCSGSSRRLPRPSRSSDRCSARSRPSSSPRPSRRSSPWRSPASTLVLQFIQGNVLVPIVMRNTVGISPFLVILSVLAGATVGWLPRGPVRRSDRGHRGDPPRGPPGARGADRPGPDSIVGAAMKAYGGRANPRTRSTAPAEPDGPSPAAWPPLGRSRRRIRLKL